MPNSGHYKLENHFDTLASKFAKYKLALHCCMYNTIYNAMLNLYEPAKINAEQEQISQHAKSVKKMCATIHLKG